MVNQNGQIAFIVIIFVGLIVAASLITDIANQEELITGSFQIDNQTVTVPGINETLDLTGRDLLTDQGITNSTNNTAPVIPVGLSLRSGIGTNGLLSVQLFANDTSSIDTGESVNVSYTYRADGFVGNASVAITQLIVLFAALGALVFVIVMLFKGPFGALLKT